MDKTEVKEKMHVEDFGLLIFFDKYGYRKQVHGKVKYVSDHGTIFFKDTERYEFQIAPESIVSFELKEMLPEPKEYKGKPITYDGGRFFYTGTKKDIDLKR